jgi:hypothetical protein
MKHGERSARRRATWKQLKAAIRAIKKQDKGKHSVLDGLPSPDAHTGQLWVTRIADELSLLDF